MEIYYQHMCLTDVSSFETLFGENMAIPTNIKNLLSGNVVEWARIEFKENRNADASLKTICALSSASQRSSIYQKQRCRRNDHQTA